VRPFSHRVAVLEQLVALCDDDLNLVVFAKGFTALSVKLLPELLPGLVSGKLQFDVWYVTVASACRITMSSTCSGASTRTSVTRWLAGVGTMSTRSSIAKAATEFW